MINLQGLKDEVAEANLDFTDTYGSTLRVVYRPGLLTPEKEEQIGASKEPGELLQFLTEFLVEWDLMEDEHNAVPITVDALRHIPSPFLMKVFFKLQEEMGPGERRSGGSFSG